MNGISAHIKQAWERSLTPAAMWGYSKPMAICQPQMGSQQTPKSAGALMLDFSLHNWEK